MTYEERMKLPHYFEPGCGGDAPGTCWGCGELKSAPVHVEPPEGYTAK